MDGIRTLTNYLVDTNIINWILDGQIDRAAFPAAGEYFITHLQIDEINRTSDEDRRARLVLALASLRAQVLPTETTTLGAR